MNRRTFIRTTAVAALACSQPGRAEDALADGEDGAEFLLGFGVFALGGEGEREEGAGGESVGMVGSVNLLAQVEDFEQLGFGFAVAPLGKEGAGVVVPVVQFVNVSGHADENCKRPGALVAKGFQRGASR